jgi:hypothetical protein
LTFPDHARIKKIRTQWRILPSRGYGFAVAPNLTRLRSRYERLLDRLARWTVYPLERLNDRLDELARIREDGGLSPVALVSWCAVSGFGLIAMAVLFTR